MANLGGAAPQLLMIGPSMILILETAVIACLKGSEDDQNEALRRAGEIDAEATHVYYAPDCDIFFFDRARRRRRRTKK